MFCVLCIWLPYLFIIIIFQMERIVHFGIPFFMLHIVGKIYCVEVFVRNLLIFKKKNRSFLSYFYFLSMNEGCLNVLFENIFGYFMLYCRITEYTSRFVIVSSSFCVGFCYWFRSCTHIVNFEGGYTDTFFSFKDIKHIHTCSIQNLKLFSFSL